MDLTAVQEIVEEEIDGMMESLGISHWKVGIEYGRCSMGDWAAECSRLYDYNRAYITIDHDHIVDEEDCRRVLRHELLHIVLAPFDLYRDLIGLAKFTEGDSTPEVRTEQAAFTNAVEKMVINLERMCVQFDRMLREARPQNKKGMR